MNTDALMKLLRSVFAFVLGYASSKGYLTPSDASALTQFGIEVGPVLIPAAMALYYNWNKKSVPQSSVAIAASDVMSGNPAPGEHVTVRGVESTHEGATVVRVVGCLLAAMILIGISAPAIAGPLADKVAADAQAKIAAVKVIIIADLEAARDDAKSNDDPASGCWIILLQHANTMPPKLMGVAHTAQRLRTLRRSLPAILDACAVVKDGARQALLQIFGGAAGGVAGLTAMGL